MSTKCTCISTGIFHIDCRYEIVCSPSQPEDARSRSETDADTHIPDQVEVVDRLKKSPPTFC